MDIQTFLINIIDFANTTLIPFIIALAFLFFIWNAFRYFIYEGDTESGKESSKRLAFWGILAFVFILSLWGIVNMLVYGFGFDEENPITPDYIEERGGSGQSGGGQGPQCIGGQICIEDPYAPGTTVCFAC